LQLFLAFSAGSEWEFLAGGGWDKFVAGGGWGGFSAGNGWDKFVASPLPPFLLTRIYTVRTLPEVIQDTMWCH